MVWHLDYQCPPSIVTLGIYSAWAKVRTKKYFYQNTYVAGRNFDYHATGKQILIGRIIVIAALLVYSFLNAASPALGGILALVLLALLPYLLVRSAKFNARNSSWSNVRFNFDQPMGYAYKVYLLYPILMALTLYTTQPFWARSTNRFGIGGHRLGKSRFTFDSGIGPFYVAAISAVVIAAIGFGCFFLLASGQTSFISALESDVPNFETDPKAIFALVVLIFFFAAAQVVYHALIRNHVFGHSKLDNHKFHSTISAGSLLAITLTNLVMVVFTLGLLLPFAQIRMHRYLAENTFVEPHGSIDAFAGEIIADSGAIGDAYSDIEGVDLGIAI
ncbi:transmembrane protein [Roseibium sp. TrichSKD4]|uniref:YjgN family protein n=1 Tax=Roseibium sp. TrichSKD4 TaxID=744980 RepID=UPI0001E56998|nr:YjgN family protein [Roseibium sp. TrichSKD4]EFO30627.1 transmembrane protein [Roseibium sp. TrichSKD4]